MQKINSIVFDKADEVEVQNAFIRYCMKKNIVVVANDMGDKCALTAKSTCINICNTFNDFVTDVVVRGYERLSAICMLSNFSFITIEKRIGSFDDIEDYVCDLYDKRLMLWINEDGLDIRYEFWLKDGKLRLCNYVNVLADDYNLMFGENGNITINLR